MSNEPTPYRTDFLPTEELRIEVFDAFKYEAAALIDQKILSRSDCESVVSSFARIAADLLERELAEAHRELAEQSDIAEAALAALSEQQAREQKLILILREVYIASVDKTGDDRFPPALMNSIGNALIRSLPDSASDTLGKPLGKPCKIKKD